MTALAVTLIVLIGHSHIVGPLEFSTQTDCSRAAQLAVRSIDSRDHPVSAICFDWSGQITSMMRIGTAGD